MHATSRRLLIATFLFLLFAGCEGSMDDDAPVIASISSPTPAVDAATLPDTTETPQGTLFGETVSSYVTVSQGIVTNVGVVIPLSAIERAPANAPFQDDLVLDMPVAAKQQTFLSQLRVNWLAHGHGPAPYGMPHFDFHFHRGTGSEIDAIACDGPASFPPEILTTDHQTPTTCVWGMGYHAWPREDGLPSATFQASLILGYTPTQLVFIEPMITRATLVARRDFELAITPPPRSGGASTRYPTRMRALYQRDGFTVRLDFDRFVDLE
jgi:hypothetical protein